MGLAFLKSSTIGENALLTISLGPMVNLINSRKNVARRYLSNFIDYTIFFAVNFAYAYAFGTHNDDGTYAVTGYKALVMPALWIIYFPLCECLWGQTLAKRALDLLVVDQQGETPSFLQAFLRRILDFLEIGTAGLLSAITISKSEKHQRMLAGTCVITTAAIV